ncbi:uncharacterized protein LOC126631657 [Malus sylvestris]|uniref:uncharacterized protein LOC126631657 n=1 Tax=Malus sylvestris TaxID=3752 RepID=UPI0021ACF32E|nr:uncharacterized protein LOC126631657 [Malus sylvestris]
MKMMRRSSENLAPINYNIHGGLLQAPPPSLSVFNHHRYQHLQQAQRQQHQHPPLLPLPVPNRPPYHHQSLPSLPSLPLRTRGASHPPATRKTNNMITRSQSLTPKKPKSKPSKKEEANKHDFKAISERLVIASTSPLGPDPNDLPKDVTRVLSSSTGKSLGGRRGGGVDMEKFSGSIFTLSPPPSSLPLPRFSLQPRLGCNSEAAAGVDAGATDNLCRLLRLR